MTPERFSAWATAQRFSLILGPLLLLAFFLSAFFWQVTVRHEVISASDIIFNSYPWVAARPTDFDHPENAYQSDDAFLGYPSRYVLFKTLKDEGLFDWQPFHLSGTPTSFPTDYLGYAFYPPAWVYFFLPFQIANSAFHILVLFTAGLGMYLLLSQLRLPRLSAVYGALLFMLNGHFIAWLGAVGLAALLGLVPLIIFGFERYRERRQPLYLVIPAGCLAAQFYLGYAPGWIVSGGVVAIYGLVRLAPLVWEQRYAAALRQLATYAATLCVGMLLAAYALVPTITSSLSSDYQTEREAGLGKVTLENAWTYLFPDYWGTPRAPAWFNPIGNYPEWVAYFGITAAPLALIGLWRLRGSWAAWFALGVLVFAVAQMYGIPPLNALAHLPGLRQTANTRWHYGVPLAVSVLAALGMACVLGDRPSPPARRFLAAGVTAALALALASVALLRLYRDDTNMWRFITEGQELVPPPSGWADLVRDWSTHLYRQVVLLLGAGVLSVLALLLRPRGARLAAAAMVLLTFADLFAFGSGYTATVKRSDVYPETPGLSFLQQDRGLYRIAPVGGGGLSVLPGYTASVYGLQTITGYDHLRDQEYLEFLGPMMSPADVEFANASGYLSLASDNRPLNRNLLSLLNVKYVVSPPGVLAGAASSWLTPEYQGGDLDVFRIEMALPRAWGVGRAEVVPTRQVVLERIASDAFDPTTAVIFAAKDLPDDMPEAGSSASGTFRVQITHYRSDAITVRTDFSQPGFLVLSERFDDGWQADVDSADAPVLRANGLLRAVPLAAGQHTVKLSFQPGEYVWGFRISAITAAVTGLGVALYLGHSAWKRLGWLPRHSRIWK